MPGNEDWSDEDSSLVTRSQTTKSRQPPTTRSQLRGDPGDHRRAAHASAGSRTRAAERVRPARRPRAPVSSDAEVSPLSSSDQEALQSHRTEQKGGTRFPVSPLSSPDAGPARRDGSQHRKPTSESVEAGKERRKVPPQRDSNSSIAEHQGRPPLEKERGRQPQRQERRRNAETSLPRYRPPTSSDRQGSGDSPRGSRPPPYRAERSQSRPAGDKRSASTSKARSESSSRPSKPSSPPKGQPAPLPKDEWDDNPDDRRKEWDGEEDDYWSATCPSCPSCCSCTSCCSCWVPLVHWRGWLWIRQHCVYPIVLLIMAGMIALAATGPITKIWFYEANGVKLGAIGYCYGSVSFPIAV